ncbi:TIGR02391 family protein [Qipengyuania psychrotolerans]|uniref:TIGR02391 family protein n=1 Tax=Qipengyuania psychrotolerans TaxID=2867238 RepID=A0ABX8ZEB4_9SPHN|nr:TIGR02391 family protein [Qipengyuania psychrotolerans]QZD87341.1 TIGR02391 family protein [Qipengyuania psychrotolerans]
MAILEQFEWVVRNVSFFTDEPASQEGDQHPFVIRDIHTKLPKKVTKLFDDAHYAEATFHAAKFVDRRVAKMSGLELSGAALMQQAFNDKNPKMALNALSNETEKTEQKGYMSLFVGLVWAIRNPRGHDASIRDEQSLCLEHLSFISMLMRRLEEAGQTF